MYDKSTAQLTILDYGLSCYAPESIGKCDSWVGTRPYHDPYLPKHGNTLETLAMADWWAFGQIIFALFTGSLLYDERTGRFRELKTNFYDYSPELHMFPKYLTQLVVDLTKPRPQNQRPTETDIIAKIIQ